MANEQERHARNRLIDETRTAVEKLIREYRKAAKVAARTAEEHKREWKLAKLAQGVERERDLALREAEKFKAYSRQADQEIAQLRAELAQPAICPNCTAKMRRLDRMDSAGHAAYELDKARKDAAGQNKRAQKAEQEAKALRAELARLTTPRPIAEAPRDGTRILAYMPSTETWMVLVWLVRKECWACPDFPHVGYYDPAEYLPLPEVKP